MSISPDEIRDQLINDLQANITKWREKLSHPIMETEIGKRVLKKRKLTLTKISLLEKIVSEYGRHTDDCQLTYGQWPCNCGLSKLHESLAKLNKSLGELGEG